MNNPLNLEPHAPCSSLNASTVNAYRETNYVVHGVESFTLHVDQTSSALAEAHKRRKVDCSAFITACNPFSQVVSESENAQRHAALRSEITQRGLMSIEGVGQHPVNQWPGEPSFLIFGLSLEAARTWGVRLAQNAIVWSGPDATPQLILLR